MAAPNDIPQELRGIYQEELKKKKRNTQREREERLGAYVEVGKLNLLCDTLRGIPLTESLLFEKHFQDVRQNFFLFENFLTDPGKVT